MSPRILDLDTEIEIAGTKIKEIINVLERNFSGMNLQVVWIEVDHPDYDTNNPITNKTRKQPIVKMRVKGD